MYLVYCSINVVGKIFHRHSTYIWPISWHCDEPEKVENRFCEEQIIQNLSKS